MEKSRRGAKIFGSTCLEWIIEEMNKRIDYNIDDLNFIVTNNGIIPEGREDIIRSGLFMGLRGDHYAALHILLPQIEHLYRNIAHNAIHYIGVDHCPQNPMAGLAKRLEYHGIILKIIDVK